MFDAGIREGKLTILVAEKEGQVSRSVAYPDGHWGEEIEWLFVSKKQNRKIVERARVVFTTVDAESPKIKDWEGRGYRPNNEVYHMRARTV
jgi:hypothetical protein